MADFPIIAQVSNQLIQFLRQALCPEVLASPELVQLIAPTDKNADFQVGLYLYDMREFNEYRSSEQVRMRGNVKTLPPKPMLLSYMLYVNPKSQMAASSEVEQRILGRAIQAFYDNTTLDIPPTGLLIGEAESVAMTPLSLAFEDKIKLWSAMNLPYQLGMYFSVAPVMISSRTAESFTRVTEITFDTAQRPQ